MKVTKSPRRLRYGPFFPEGDMGITNSDSGRSGTGRVVRETATVIRKRALVIELRALSLRVRLKGMRLAYDVDYEAVFQIGAKKAAEAERAAQSGRGRRRRGR